MSNTDRVPYKRPDYFPKAPEIVVKTPRGSSKPDSPKAGSPRGRSKPDSPKPDSPKGASPKEIAKFKGKYTHNKNFKKGCEKFVRCSETCLNFCIGGTCWTANRILFFFITALHPIIFWFYRNMALEATEGLSDVLEKSVNLIPTFMKEATTAVIKGLGPKQIPCILKNEKYAKKLREYIAKIIDNMKKISLMMYGTAKKQIETILPFVVKNLYETFKQGGSLPRISENIVKSIFRNTSLEPLTKMIKQSSILPTDILSNQTYPHIDVLLKQLNQSDYKFESSLEPIGILGSVIKYPKHSKYHDDIIDRLEQEGVHIKTGFLNSLFESFDEAMCESQFEALGDELDRIGMMMFLGLAGPYNNFVTKLSNTRDKEFPYVNNSYVTLLITCIVLMIMFGLTPIIFRKFFKKLRELIGFKDEDKKMKKKDARIEGNWVVTGKDEDKKKKKKDVIEENWVVTGKNWVKYWKDSEDSEDSEESEDSQFKKSKAKKSPTKKSVKKNVKKSVKKSAKKSLKKSAKKSLKKSAKKSLKKSAKKSLKKSAKKSLKKSAKKSLKKSAKKKVKKSLNKSLTKQVKKPKKV